MASNLIISPYVKYQQIALKYKKANYYIGQYFLDAGVSISPIEAKFWTSFFGQINQKK